MKKETFIWWVLVPAALVIIPRLLGQRAWQASGLPPISELSHKFGGEQEFLFKTQGEALAKANQLTSAGWSFVRVEEVSV